MDNRRVLLLAFLGLVVLTIGCLQPEEAEIVPPLSPPPMTDGEKDFQDMEDRLLAASTVLIRAKITAEGAFSADLLGESEIKRGNRIKMKYEGDFGDKQHRLELRSDGEMLRGGSPMNRLELACPGKLNEGVLLGATRMGLLHNLAMLTQGAPPDRTDGTIRDWVKLSKFRLGPIENRGGLWLQSLEFSIAVSDEPAGDVTLWIDLSTRLPFRRTQSVQFGDQKMHVLEQYEVFEILD